jgi:hypothetical protein
MAGQEPCLALAELVDRRGIEGHRYEVAAVVGVRHLHILQPQASHHNASVLQVVDEGLGLAQHMVDHKLAMACDGYDQSGDGCRGGRSFHLLVVEHMERLAYHLEQHLLGRRFEKHRLKLQGLQIVPRAAQKVCYQRNKLQYEQHQRHRGQQEIAQWTGEGMHQKHSGVHPTHLGSHEF